MAWPFKLLGSRGPAETSPNGEVLVRPYDYSEPSHQSIESTSAHNFFGLNAGEQLVVTGLFASANRSIPAAGEVVEIYEASAIDSNTIDKLLFSMDIARQQVVQIGNLNFLINRDKFVNGYFAGSSGAVKMTLFGYFIPVAEGE